MVRVFSEQRGATIELSYEKAWEHARELRGTKRDFYDHCRKRLGGIPDSIAEEHTALELYIKSLLKNDNSIIASPPLATYIF